MKSNQPPVAPRTLPLLAALVVGALLVSAIFGWHLQRLETGRRQQVYLERLQTGVHAANAAEWRLIAVAGNLDHVAGSAPHQATLSTLADPATGHFLTPDSLAAVARYVAAVQRETTLLRSGQVAAAREWHESEVDPAFTRLAATLAREAADVDARLLRLKVIAITGGNSVLALLTLGLGLLIQSQHQRRRQLEAAARRQVDFLESINQTVLDLVGRRQLDELLPALAERAARLLDSPYAEIALLEGEDLVVRSFFGPTVSAVGDRADRSKAVFSWRAVDRREPVFVEDFGTRTEARELYARWAFEQVGIFPILQGEACLGVISLLRDASGTAFSPEDRQKGQLLAQVVALVLHNASIYDAARREAERQTAALIESEQRFRGVFNRTPTIVALLNLPEGRIIEINPAATAAFGYSVAEAAGRTTAELNLWADPEQRLAYLTAMQTQGQVTDFEARLRRRDGSLFTVLCNGSVVSLGDRPYTLNTLIDISARKQAEAALRESERHYRTLVESVAHGYYVADRRGFFTYCNPALYALGGFAPGELLGTSCFRVICAEDRPRVMATYRAWSDDPACATGTCEFRVRVRTGRIFWVAQTTDFQRDAAGRVREGRNLLHDITERKHAEQALRESEARLTHALEATNEGLWDWNIRTGEVFYSPQWIRLIGHPPAEVKPHTDFFLGLLHPDDVAGVYQALNDHFSGLIPIKQSEVRLRTPDGGYRWFLDRGKVIEHDAAGRPSRMVGTITDINDRKQAEAAITHSLASLRATLESTADGILTIGPDRRIASYNSPFAAMWRIPAEVLAARDDDRALQCVLDQLAHPEEFLQKVRHLYAHPEEESFDTLSFRDGRVFERYSRPMLVAGLPAGRVWSFRDVTQHRVAEAALRASEEKFRGVFDQSPVMMGLLSVPDGRLVEFNAAGIAAFGFTREEALGRTSVELGLWVDDADRVAYLERLRTHGSVEGFETRMRRKNGETFPVVYNGSLIRIGGETYSLNSVQDLTARHRAEESLRASEQRFERVVRNISDAILIDDLAGRVLYANDRCRELFGLGPAEDLNGVRIEDYVAPEYRVALRERHDRRVRGEAMPSHFDYEAIRPDGSRLWVEVNVTTVIVDGRITGTQSINRDITGRKITEQAMLLLSTGTATLRGEALFQHVAAKVAQLFGADLGLVARSLDTTPPRARTLGLCIDGQVQPGREYDLAGTPCAAMAAATSVILPAGAARQHPDDPLLQVHGIEGFAAAPLHDLAGVYLGYVALLSRRPLRHPAPLLESVLRMIALKLSAEIEHDRAEHRFRDLFAFAPDAILIATQEGLITDVNQRALTLFGYTREELVGRTAADLIPPAHRPALLERLGRYLANPRPHGMGESAPGLFAWDKAGRVFPIDISLSPIHSGQVTFVAAAVRDTTRQAEAEDRLRQSQKIESLGTLAGGIAHDFNNILTGMLGSAEVARLELPDNHPVVPWLNNITVAGHRARDLVQQILTFGRKHESELAPRKLQLVVAEALRLLRSTLPSMVQLKSSIDPGCPPVIADDTQIHQVVMNLCTNSWHALPETGGRIEVGLEVALVTPEQTPTLPGLTPGPHVLLTVRDNGCGMTSEVLARIFEPFYTTKRQGKGTGLGLAVVHGIIQTHHGAIFARSSPGLGTIFEVYLPALQAGPGAVLPAGDMDLPRGHGEHVLLVDDDDVALAGLRGQLEYLGYRVTAFADAPAALRFFLDQPAAVALVLTDYAMPELTGQELLTRLLAERPGLPAILATGFIDPQQQEKIRATGVGEIVRKPLSLSDLARLLARLLPPAR